MKKPPLKYSRKTFARERVISRKISRSKSVYSEIKLLEDEYSKIDNIYQKIKLNADLYKQKISELISYRGQLFNLKQGLESKISQMKEINERLQVEYENGKQESTNLETKIKDITATII